jgi:dihydrofolate reductase
VRRLISFMSVSVDGHFADAQGDMRWAHNAAPDPEWDAFVAGNASGGGTLVFGRITYEMMASFWPTPHAMKMNAVVAERMNAGEKIVFSRTLETAAWSNTTLVKGEMIAEMRKIKAGNGPGMAILGSGSVVKQLAEAGLIDEFQIVVVPVALGAGRTLFAGIQKRLGLKLLKTRPFKNGNVLLCYEPARREA